MTELTEFHRQRLAICYVRQSSIGQVLNHQESARRQRDLSLRAAVLGWSEDRIMVLDKDLGFSGSGTCERPDFLRMVQLVMAGQVGLVLYTEVSRVSRNDKDWVDLMQLCRFHRVLLGDERSVYDPRVPEDMILLGILSTVSVFELTMIRQRLQAGFRQKAMRGELYAAIAPGYAYMDGKLVKHPNQEVCDSIQMVFEQFARLQSASKVLQWFQEAQLPLPTGPSVRNPYSYSWKPPSYPKMLSILTNPVYSGAYVFGRSRSVEVLKDGRLTHRRQRRLPASEWACRLEDQHEAYITSEQYMKNQERLCANSPRERGQGLRQVRNGSALLAGLVRCRRCGNKLMVRYHNHSTVIRYECFQGGKQRANGNKRCLTVSALNLDEIVAGAVCAVVQPAAIAQAIAARRELEQDDPEKLRLLNNRLEQLRYESSLARRRYEQVDPENRLVSRKLEADWEAAMQAVDRQEEIVHAALAERQVLDESQIERLHALAAQFHRVWSSLHVSDLSRKKLIAALVEEVILDHDIRDDTIIALVHWRGGRHTEYRLAASPGRQPAHAAAAELKEVICTLRDILDDAQIAITLNRVRMPDLLGVNWTAERIREFREEHRIKSFSEPEKASRGLLTQAEAAARLGISAMAVFRMIERGLLPAKQICRGLPRIIREDDLLHPGVQQHVAKANQASESPASEPTLWNLSEESEAHNPE